MPSSAPTILHSLRIISLSNSLQSLKTELFDLELVFCICVNMYTKTRMNILIRHSCDVVVPPLLLPYPATLLLYCYPRLLTGFLTHTLYACTCTCSSHSLWCASAVPATPVSQFTACSISISVDWLTILNTQLASAHYSDHTVIVVLSETPR